jgi:hypothetical protein
MTERTLVAVYAVGAGGATGDRLGTASLIDPLAALAHPGLRERLVAQPGALRAGIVPAGGGGVEVIDVAVTQVVEEAPDLVVLTFVRESLSPPAEVSIPDQPTEFGNPDFPPANDPFELSQDEAVAALRAVLATARADELAPTPPIPTPSEPEPPVPPRPPDRPVPPPSADPQGAPMANPSHAVLHAFRLCKHF